MRSARMLNRIVDRINLEIAYYSKRTKLKKLYNPRVENLDLEHHIKEATSWLVRAQDCGSDRGISYGCELGDKLWPSYPETTGYIIPTFIKFSEFYKDSEYLMRALEMGHWEADVQMQCGAVMGGMVNSNPTPAIFNTGQVLLGWGCLINESNDSVIIDAGYRAAEWMTQMQSDNGEWINGNSSFSDKHTTTYNVRAAWGLAKFGKAVGEPKYIEAALKFTELVKVKQQDNGWFDDCCLSNAEKPLLHTLAYTMRGYLELGIQENISHQTSHCLVASLLLTQ